MKLDKDYWQERWESENTPWDIGYSSPAIVNYMIEQVSKDAKILIPGCGNAYEAEDLMAKGFSNIHIVDLSPSAISSFKKRVPNFPQEQIHCADFFKLEGTYDVIIEQTFFCALDPSMREAYASKMNELLAPGAKLIGLMFNIPLNDDKPPFGGNKLEYTSIFETYFEILEMEVTQDSIKPRMGTELFICLEKK